MPKVYVSELSTMSLTRARYTHFSFYSFIYLFLVYIALSDIVDKYCFQVGQLRTPSAAAVAPAEDGRAGRNQLSRSAPSQSFR
jgi:hypothetical protein